MVTVDPGLVVDAADGVEAGAASGDAAGVAAEDLGVDISGAAVVFEALVAPSWRGAAKVLAATAGGLEPRPEPFSTSPARLDEARVAASTWLRKDLAESRTLRVASCRVAPKPAVRAREVIIKAASVQ